MAFPVQKEFRLHHQCFLGFSIFFVQQSYLSDVRHVVHFILCNANFSIKNFNSFVSHLLYVFIVESIPSRAVKRSQDCHLQQHLRNTALVRCCLFRLRRSSSHLFLGLPTHLCPIGLYCQTCLASPESDILSECSFHRCM